jgi:hypothetical protein
MKAYTQPPQIPHQASDTAQAGHRARNRNHSPYKVALSLKRPYLCGLNTFLISPWRHLRCPSQKRDCNHASSGHVTMSPQQRNYRPPHSPRKNQSKSPPKYRPRDKDHNQHDKSVPNHERVITTLSAKLDFPQWIPLTTSTSACLALTHFNPHFIGRKPT